MGKIILIHILSNISKNNDNQKMKFGQLIEYIMRNIFLENSYTKCDTEIIFLKIKIEHISGSTVESFIQFVFNGCQSRGISKFIETKVEPTCFYLI